MPLLLQAIGSVRFRVAGRDGTVNPMIQFKSDTGTATREALSGRD
jgi:hypothetical protein